MDDRTALQWAAVMNEIARLSGIRWGNASVRIEDGKPIGLLEIRETFKVDIDWANEMLAEATKKIK